MYSQNCLQRSATGITKVAFVDRWPLFGTFETTFQFSRDELRLAFVDRKPLLAGVLKHRFDCIYETSVYNMYTNNIIIRYVDFKH